MAQVILDKWHKSDWQKYKRHKSLDKWPKSETIGYKWHKSILSHNYQITSEIMVSRGSIIWK